MGRIFALISVIAILMIFVSGISVYWLSAAKIETANNKSAQLIAQGVASTLTAQISFITESIDKLAHDEQLLLAIENNDSAGIKARARFLQNYLPNAMIFRVLLPGINEIENSEVPHMGYADLDLVKETFGKNSLPVVQGTAGANRHLAIARQIMQGDQVIAVLLASMKYDFLHKTFNQFDLQHGLLELRQGDLLLSHTGDPESKQDTKAQSIPVLGKTWNIKYWPSSSGGSLNLWVLFGIVAIPCLITGLVMLVFYRKLADMLHSDQSTLLKAVKDLMTGKAQGNYPVVFEEMRAVITTLIQFKRVLDNGGVDMGSEPEEDGLDISGFFEDMSEDMGFMSSPAMEVTEETVDATSPVKLDISETAEEAPADFSDDQAAHAHDEVFRAYDIRGIVDTTLNADLVQNIGRAIGSIAKEQEIKTVVIARDGRLSSPTLIASLSQGIMATGRDVLDLGLVPTPILYFVTQHTPGKTGVMLTGSHNPPEYNGLKIVIAGETLNGEKIQQLKQRIEENRFATGEPGERQENQTIVNEYIGTIADDLHMVRPMKVVIDCGNGATGELAPTLLKTLGCDVVELHCDIDGNFPNHHPDPSNPDNLEDLIKAVLHYEADVGFAFDGDGDRLGVVDSKGKIIWADRQLMLFAKDVLAQKPGGEIIFDVKCSRHLATQIGKFGGHATMWKTGHSLIKAKLKENSAILAGEMSGHIFFNDRWFGFDDGLYAAARMIELLSSDTRSSHEVFADFPDSINTPELNVAVAESEKSALIEQLTAAADFGKAKIIDIDGMRVEYDDGWGLVRASNTTPALVLRFEADNEEALQRIQDKFRQLLTSVKTDLVLPF